MKRVSLADSERRCRSICFVAHYLSLNYQGGRKVSCPFGPALSSTRPNNSIHLDHTDLGVSCSGEKYVLMVRSNHDGYSWLYSKLTSDANAAASALLECCFSLAPRSWFMASEPACFMNETIRLLTEGLNTRLQFNLRHFLMSIGVAEHLDKELLRVVRALLSELQTQQSAWP